MGPSEIAALINKKRPAVQRLMLAMTQQGQLQWIPGGKYELKKEGGHEKL